MVTGPACGERLVAAAAASEGANLTISGKEFVENQSLAESQPCLPPHQSLSGQQLEIVDRRSPRKSMRQQAASRDQTPSCDKARPRTRHEIVCHLRVNLFALYWHLR